MNNELIEKLADFLVEYQLEENGAPKLKATALLEAKNRVEYHDFVVKAIHSVDGKEHIFEVK